MRQHDQIYSDEAFGVKEVPCGKTTILGEIVVPNALVLRMFAGEGISICFVPISVVRKPTNWWTHTFRRSNDKEFFAVSAWMIYMSL